MKYVDMWIGLTALGMRLVAAADVSYVRHIITFFKLIFLSPELQCGLDASACLYRNGEMPIREVCSFGNYKPDSCCGDCHLPQLTNVARCDDPLPLDKDGKCPYKKIGQTCRQISECADFESGHVLCDAGVCRVTVEGPCKTTSDCFPKTANLTCEGGRCLAQRNETCRSSVQCVKGTRCADGFCLSPAGGVCATTSDCGDADYFDREVYSTHALPLICENKTCVYPFDQACGSNFCARAPGLRRDTAVVCRVDSNDSRDATIPQRCRPVAKNDDCTSNLDCSPRTCNGGKCRSELHQGCSVTSECVAGLSCDTIVGLCKSKSAQKCGKHSECQSRWCYNGTCSDPSPPSCTLDTDCDKLPCKYGAFECTSVPCVGGPLCGTSACNGADCKGKRTCAGGKCLSQAGAPCKNDAFCLQTKAQRLVCSSPDQFEQICA